jgi:glycosyltransferase involved in cell wall biosynthesis
MTTTPAAGLVSVVVVTYEWPAALDAVLRALSEQAGPPFEVVVADDGSGPETAAVVARWQDSFGERLRHVWQPDEGWRQGRNRNLGALEARGDYLVFLDGDCLVRRGFLQAVRRAALPGWFLAGKRLHLSERLSRRVLDENVPVWRWSTMRWLLATPRELLSSHREAGRPGVLLPVRDRRRPWREGQPEFFPPFAAYGYFFGISRSDLERANGFDMRFVGWGGEDEDLAARLRRLGLRCGWPGPRATLLHLWHAPRKGVMPSNRPLVDATEEATHVEALEGLRELRAELGRYESANRVGASSSSSEPTNV